MAKLDWSKAGRTTPDPGAVTELNEYERPPRQSRARSRLTPIKAAELLERSEAIRLKAVAKKREIEAAGGKWTGTKKDRQHGATLAARHATGARTAVHRKNGGTKPR